MKRTLTPFLALFIFAGCGRQMVVRQLKKLETHVMAQNPQVHVFQPAMLAKTKSLAVLDFRVMNVVGETYMIEMFEGSLARGKAYLPSDNAGVLMAESLEEALLKTGKIRVVERSQLERTLSLNEFQLSDLAWHKHHKPLSRKGSVDAVLLGTLANAVFYYPEDPRLPFLEEYGLRLRLLDVKSGKIIATVKDKTVQSDVMNSRYLNDTEENFYLMAERLSSALISVIKDEPSKVNALIDLVPQIAPESPDTVNVLKEK